jgi:outer membrane protein TolC
LQIAAFSDVARAQFGTKPRRATQNEALREACHALNLAQSRYRSGAKTWLRVLQPPTAQQTSYRAGDDKVQLRLARLQDVSRPLRATGSGRRDDTAKKAPSEG